MRVVPSQFRDFLYPISYLRVGTAGRLTYRLADGKRTLVSVEAHAGQVINAPIIGVLPNGTSAGGLTTRAFPPGDAADAATLPLGPVPPDEFYDGTFPLYNTIAGDEAVRGNAGAWEDPAGVWTIAAGMLWGENAAASDGFLTQFLKRPVEEAQADCAITVSVPHTFRTGSALLGQVLRLQANGDHYLAHTDGASSYVYRVRGGTPTLVGSHVWGGGPYIGSHPYDFEFSVAGTSPVSLRVRVWDTYGPTPTLYDDYTVTDSSGSRLTAAGPPALSCWQDTSVRVTRVQIRPVR